LRGWGSTREDEEGDEHGPKLVPSFTKAHDTSETVKLLFYTYSISKHDKQNILNSELALIPLKPKTSTKQLSVNRFL
jgi:hypothetical protein